MRFWETEHTHSFPWDTVATGYWSRYPNQHSSHVFSVDMLETKLVDGKLYCRRLIIKTNPLPSWGKHFFSARRVPVIEECIVDPVDKQLTWYVRNIGLTTFMGTVEKAQVTQHTQDPGLSTIRKQVWIDSSILGFRSAIRKFGIDRYKKNCILATEGFETVLKRMNEGRNPGNLSSGLNTPAIHLSAKRCDDVLSSPSKPEARTSNQSKPEARNVNISNLVSGGEFNAPYTYKNV